MRTFTCDSCAGTLYFENDTCLACRRKVGFRHDNMMMLTVAAATALGMHPCRDWTEYGACLLSVGPNQLNRSIGIRDAYPFAVSDRVIEKPAFIHEIRLHAPRDRVPQSGRSFLTAGNASHAQLH